MSRRLVALALTVAFAAALVPLGVSAQTAAPVVPDTLRAWSIVPPGQDGNVTPAEYAAGDFGPNFDDQLGLYASLIDTDDVTEETIGDYFHPMQFGATDLGEPYEPTEGVTVYRDGFGIPHIYADSFDAASFAMGYATAEDRLWEADVFRHAARGTLSQFIGPDYLPMDIEARREGYTEEEVQKMFDDFDDKFGALGLKIQTGLEQYAAGINAYIEELRMNPTQCPAEYQLLGNPCPEPEPADWTPTDTLFVAILQLRVFGETAGSELQNAALYSQLVKKNGPTLGARIYEDLLRRNDPRSATTIPTAEGKFPSQAIGSTNMKSVAIPDGAEEVARKVAKREMAYEDFLATLGFRAPASNALIVGSKESKTGNPLQIGAPQVGYAVPSFFWDVDVHVSGAEVADFRGPAVPGASALIPLGRGPDYAWTLTTGYSDAVDTKVELLCDPEGGEATIESNGYMFNGECKEMESREEQFIVKPSAGSPGAPSVESRTFYRTQHGPVFERGEVDGKPVAFVKERFFWMRETDSIPQFYKWNAEVDGIEDFKAAASKFTMSFNTFYADHKDIGYFHVGYYPKRPKGYSPSLPTWGTGKWEWSGRLPFKRHPKVINPEQGWVANWNNKPAKGWDNYDGIKWGPIHRVQLLQDEMHHYMDGPKKARLSDLVDVIRKAATRDTRAVYLGPKMLNATKGLAATSDEGKGRALVKAWIAAGAEHLNRDYADGDTLDDNGPAVAIFDAWYRALVHRVFDDEIGADSFDLVPTPIADQDMWHDFSSFLLNTFKRTSRSQLARNYCDNRSTPVKESCKLQVAKALDDAIKVLKVQQGNDMSAWTFDAWMIEMQELGVGSVDPIPWQNRGTHNQVIEILSKAGEVVPTPSASGSPSPTPSS